MKDIQARLENERNRLKELKVKLSEGALEEREGSYGKREEAATETSKRRGENTGTSGSRRQSSEPAVNSIKDKKRGWRDCTTLLVVTTGIS